jgi:hypothetical protein
MIVVGYVIKVNEAADNEVLQALFLDPSSSQLQNLDLIRPQMLDPEFLGRSRIIERREIELKRMEARPDGALGRDENTWNIDRLLFNEFDGPRDNRGDIRPADSFEFELHGSVKGFNLPSHDRLNIRVFEIT